jgi:hypothetical protein
MKQYKIQYSDLRALIANYSKHAEIVSKHGERSGPHSYVYSFNCKTLVGDNMVFEIDDAIATSEVARAKLFEELMRMHLHENRINDGA